MELNPSGDLDDIYKTYIKIIKSKNKNQTKNDFFSKLDNKHFTLDQLLAINIFFKIIK